MFYRHRTLETPHGRLETPVLFPVRNIGKRSTDNTPQYTDTIPEFNTAMVNGRAIRRRGPQWKRIQNGVTLREELDVSESTIIFADSGGFDFQSGDVDITPKISLETQEMLDADIIGTVDVPLSPENRLSENEQHVESNIEWALTASEEHEGESLLFASVHGYDPQTIRNGIKHLERNGEFDGFAIGSLVPIRTNYKKVISLILSARRTTNKHLHVYGLGGLVYQPLLLYLGVDSFDSSSFIRSAGKRRYLVPGFGGEKLRDIENLEYLPCSCPVCGTRKLRVIREERDLLALHNLWALAMELRRFKYMVEANEDIENYLTLRFRGNEVTGKAFKIAQQRVRRLT